MSDRPSFREFWESWLAASADEPVEDPTDARRHDFYAGAIAVMGAFVDILDSGRPITMDDTDYLSELRWELEVFSLEVARSM
jgi:hypothetical protein